MSTTSHADRLLLVISRMLGVIDDLSDTDRLLAVVHTMADAPGAKGEIRLAWNTDTPDGGRQARHFRITVEEVL